MEFIIVFVEYIDITNTKRRAIVFRFTTNRTRLQTPIIYSIEVLVEFYYYFFFLARVYRTPSHL